MEPRFPEGRRGDIREHELIAPGGEVTCLVSGGADSTCLWHVLRELGYGVSALHVNHGLRGAESDEDAALLPGLLGAEVVDGSGRRAPRTSCASIRYSFAADRLRATGHTASDQVETVLYRLVCERRARRGSTRAATTASSARCSPSGARRPRPTASPRASTSARDTSNPDTKRGLIRDEILPLLRRLHPRRGEPAAARGRKTRAAGLAELLDSRSDGSTRRRPRRRASDRPRVRPRLARARPRSRSTGRCAGGRGGSRPSCKGLKVRGWRPGDRLGRAEQEDPGRVRRRQGAPLGARGVAARRARRRGGRRARDRRSGRRWRRVREPD